MDYQAQVAALAPAHAVTRRNPKNEFSGVFIGLSVPLATAQAVAVHGGTPPDELHVTLAYLGNVNGYTRADLPRFQQVMTMLQGITERYLPLRAQFSGSGRFTQATKDAAYLGVDAPGLERLQRECADAATLAGFTVSTEHGFTPHCTVRYLAKEEAHPQPAPPSDHFTFATLELWLAGQRVIFLPGSQAQALVKADAPGDQRREAQTVLAQLAGDHLVLNGVDNHLQRLTDHAHDYHQDVFTRLIDATGHTPGSALEETALHHADEAARARRVADLPLTQPFTMEES